MKFSPGTRISRSSSASSWSLPLPRAAALLSAPLYKGMRGITFADLTVQYAGGQQDEHLVMNVCLRFVKFSKYKSVAPISDMNVLTSCVRIWRTRADT
jgi:hypothetical protein